MSLGAFTVPIENGMRVRHDAQARFTVKAGRKVLEDDLTPIESLGGAITRAGIMYNRLTMSGGVSWWDPSTGQPISKPKYEMRVRPEDVLTGEQLCTCSICV
jgi:hypothetical protein